MFIGLLSGTAVILELKIARGHLALEVARRHFNRDTLWSQN
jgi:hypothetical protein